MFVFTTNQNAIYEGFVYVAHFMCYVQKENKVMNKKVFERARVNDIVCNTNLLSLVNE